MSRQGVIAPDLRALFLTLARVALAAAPIAGCSEVHQTDDGPAEERSGDGDETQEPHEPHDTGAPFPEAMPPDGGIDGGDAQEEPIIGKLPDAGGPWERVPCDRYNALALPEPPLALAPAQDADFLAVYVDYQPGTADDFARSDAGQVPRKTSLRARVGEACSGVSDSANCERELARLQATPACETRCTFTIVGEGERLTRLETRDELVALFGSIDTAAEAVMLAAFDGRPLCSTLNSDPLDIGTEVRAREGAGFDLRTTIEQCSATLFRDELTVEPDGALSLVSHVDLKRSLCMFGRRPDGFAPAREGSAGSAAAFLASAAELEAASVYAFYQLILELRAHGAPEELRQLALDALLDEVQHAHAMGALACSYGAEPRAPALSSGAPRSLLDLALNNASEGCVREAFGALLATYQAESASDPRVRSLMAEIALDETRHATLSWKLAAWLEPQLSSAQRAEVQGARQRAYRELAEELRSELPPAERAQLGMPPAWLATRMLAGMQRALA